ncbi:MAG TPA: phosphotransferase family protein [Bryobacteraceae bacterium]|nr:phosphotransferase family protein [Bryobacteraceae bacterium]
MDHPILPGVIGPDRSFAVRSGEELDAAALSAYLAQPVEIEQFPGGHSNLVYLVRTPVREYVLRRPPLGPVAHKAHDMAREYRVLNAIHAHFSEAPEALSLCEDPAVIGAPFFLMERRRGIILRDEAPTALATEAFVDCLARLHNVDVSIPEIAALGRPQGFVVRQVTGWRDRWHRAKTEESPAMDAVIAWLEARIPASPAPVVIHNDYKFDNVILNPDMDRIEAVLDWEMSTLGDPLADVGLALCYWGQILSPPWTRDEFVQRYAVRSGRDVENLPYYEVLGIFKLAVILQQIYYRYHRGQTHDERFRTLDERVRYLIAWAAERVASA